MIELNSKPAYHRRSAGLMTDRHDRIGEELDCYLPRIRGERMAI